MKINQTPGQPPVVTTGRTQSPTGGSSNFQQMLAARLATVSESSQTAAVSPTPPVEALVGPALRLASLDLTESAIDTLESFGAALGNTGIDPDGLEPFIAALEDETAALLDIKQHLPAEDPLAKMLEQVATVTFLESSKFRRGDYHS